MSKILSAAAALAVVSALVVTSASDAEAAFKLRLTELGADRALGGIGADADTVVIIEDNGATDENGLAGVINYGQNIGSFMVNVNIGFSKPSLGSAAFPEMHLTNVQLSSELGGTILIDLTDTGFLPGSSPKFFATEFGGAGSGDVSLQAYVNTDNQEFSKTGTQIADFSSFGAIQTAYAAVDTVYSLSLFSHVSLDPNSATSFDAVVRVPEPQTLALFGIGLLGLGFLARRRKEDSLDG